MSGPVGLACPLDHEVLGTAWTRIPQDVVVDRVVASRVAIAGLCELLGDVACTHITSPAIGGADNAHALAPARSGNLWAHALAMQTHARAIPRLRWQKLLLNFSVDSALPLNDEIFGAAYRRIS